ncbi:MAG: hypothetical protein AM326_12015 [Candidatus Thorarchaeota archaeon SMTZ-45]|nr:MAG: hypothetical protein AM326_12015 [Candidatus Thorarchaeota archaeon SMTZ-45]KXH73043.1 MAG: hypothetical protein AM325_08360 [Candidatus Thorarchaeota archaeon SMTZ1-45]
MKNAKTSESRTLKSGAAGAIMAIIAVLAPAGLNVIFDPVTGWIIDMSLICMLWTLPIRFGINNPPGTFADVSPVPNEAIPTPFVFIGNLPVTFLRLVFVYQIYKLYQGRTTRKRTMLVGAASELQMAIIGILGAIIPVFSLSSRLFIPLPILFLAALVTIKVVPPLEVSTPWKNPEDSESWWAKSSKYEKGMLQVEKGSQ